MTQDSVITIWNVVLGLAVLLWAFGFTQAKQMLFKNRRRESAAGEHEQPGAGSASDVVRSGS